MTDDERKEIEEVRLRLAELQGIYMENGGLLPPMRATVYAGTVTEAVRCYPLRDLRPETN